MKPGLLACLILWPALAGCGGAPAPPEQFSGPASCSETDRQDLSFSGGISGHLRCSVEPATCLLVNEGPAVGGSFYYRALLKARQAGRPLALYIGAGGFTYRGPGEYAIPPQASVATSSVEMEVGPAKNGVIDQWRAASGGTVTVTADDVRALTGSVRVRLEAVGHPATRLTGRWSCLKQVAPAPPG